LEHGDLDLAITLLPAQVAQKTFVQPLLNVPLILLVPKASSLQSAEFLWKLPEIQENLICLAQDEMICREFQEALKRMEVDWRPGIEVGSIDLVEHYVQQGYGIGLAVRVPGRRLSPKVRIIDLPKFPLLRLGMLWRDNEDKLINAFREEALTHAKQFVH
jgi:DNA-binding transcriptional LysR family regulator